MSKQRQDPKGHRNWDDPRDVWDKVMDFAQPAVIGGAASSLATAALARRSRAYKAGVMFGPGAIGGGLIFGPILNKHNAANARYEQAKKRRK